MFPRKEKIENYFFPGIEKEELSFIFVNLLAFTCLNLTIERLEQGVKYAQS